MYGFDNDNSAIGGCGLVFRIVPNQTGNAHLSTGSQRQHAILFNQPQPF